MNLSKAMEEFLNNCEYTSMSERTVKSYKNNNKALVDYIEKRFNIVDINEVDHTHIQAFLKFKKDEGLKESYINNLLKCHRAFFSYCVNFELIKNNPCMKIYWQKEPKTLIKPFNDEEVIRIKDVYDFSSYLKARNKTIIMFLIETGARCFEICSLKEKDIYGDKIKIMGKGNKERLVPLSDDLKECMRKYYILRKNYFNKVEIKDDNYFLSNRGKVLTVNMIEKIVGDAGECANVRKEIRCSPHTFRHYYAQTMIRLTKDIYDLARVLGHESIEITRRYLQSMEDEEIVKNFANMSPSKYLRELMQQPNIALT